MFTASKYHKFNEESRLNLGDGGISLATEVIQPEYQPIMKKEINKALLVHPDQSIYLKNMSVIFFWLQALLVIFRHIFLFSLFPLCNEQQWGIGMASSSSSSSLSIFYGLQCKQNTVIRWMTQEMVITKVPSRSVVIAAGRGSGHVCCRCCYVTKCINPAAGEAFKRPLKYGLLVSTPLKKCSLY